MSADPTPSPDLKVCAQLVRVACTGRYVPVAAPWRGLSDVWLDCREIGRHAGLDDTPGKPRGWGTPMLRRAAAAGLIAEMRVDPGGSYLFTTLSLAEQWHAEASLTAEQRAQRTADAVRDLYADRRAHYGDTVALWPVSGNLAAVPQDGIKHAVKQGLLVRHDPRGRLWTHSGLVPADQYDAFAQALTDAEQRERRSRAMHSDLVDQVHAAVGGDRYTVDHLTIPQLRAIVALLPTTQEGPTP